MLLFNLNDEIIDYQRANMKIMHHITAPFDLCLDLHIVFKFHPDTEVHAMYYASWKGYMVYLIR